MASSDSLNPSKGSSDGKKKTRRTKVSYEKSKPLEPYKGKIKVPHISRAKIRKYNRVKNLNETIDSQKKLQEKEYNQALREYKQQYNRINKFIDNATVRGYHFDKKSISIMVPDPYNASFRTTYDTNYVINLTEGAKTLKPKQLYEFATYTTETGEVITGTERRKQERSESAKKAAQTRKQKQNPLEPSNEEGFDEQQRQQDEQNQERLRQDQEFANQFQKGEIVYNKIKSMIYEAYQAGMGEGHELLENLLDEQIDTYGYEQEMRMIGQADESDLMESAEIVCFDSDQNEVQFNLSRIAMLITGTIPSAQESAQMSDVQDQDSYTNTTT